MQDHLVSLGTNSRNWPTTNFWARAAKSTSWSSSGNTVLVSVNQIGVRQRYFGGTISPVKAKALAIPISPVSYGHVPRDFQNLFLLVTKKGAYLCQYGEAISEHGNVVKGRKLGGNGGRRKRAALNFLFKLVGSVTQAADASVLPTDEQFLATAGKAIEEAV